MRGNLVMFKKLKGKVIVGVLVFGLIMSGAGLAFANTDAGAALKAWYDGMFNQSVDTIEDEVTAYGESKLPELQEEYENLKSEAGIDIDLSRELATGESLEKIIQAKLDHLGSLDESKREILSNIGYQYYNVFLDGYGEIQQKAEEGLAYATDDLTAYTGELGQAAVDEMTGDLNAAKDEAVQELEEAIRQAQEELGAAISENEEITIRNLKNQVDWSIEELRNQVTELLAGLVEEQKTIIIATAQQLEDDAKAAMDDVVSGINN